MPVAIEGLGTEESRWRGWDGWRDFPKTCPCDFLCQFNRAVVVSPHPDDEVLALGASMTAWAAAGIPVLVVSVTDGEASHPESGFWTRADLADTRSKELEEAIRVIGGDTPIFRLAMPDGGLMAVELDLADRIEALCAPGDVIFCTWRGDGHPDHEAVGRAASRVALRMGVQLVEVPVWTWHWAQPGDPRVPWHRMKLLGSGDEARRRKRLALNAFQSQTHIAPGDTIPPILPPNVLERFDRPFEAVFL